MCHQQDEKRNRVECNDIEEVFQFTQYVLHRLSVKLTNGWLTAAVLPQS